jgi:hypothetical protein
MRLDDGTGNSSSNSRCTTPVVGVDEHVASHAVTSPGFTRAVVTHSVSAGDLPSLSTAGQQRAAAVAAPVPTADSSRRSSSGGATPQQQQEEAQGGGQASPWLPHLRRLLLRACFTPPSAIAAVLGIPSASSTGGSTGSSSATTRCALEVLGVTDEVGDPSSWIAVLRHTRALQVSALRLGLPVPLRLGAGCSCVLTRARPCPPGAGPDCAGRVCRRRAA